MTHCFSAQHYLDYGISLYSDSQNISLNMCQMSTPAPNMYSLVKGGVMQGVGVLYTGCSGPPDTRFGERNTNRSCSSSRVSNASGLEYKGCCQNKSFSLYIFLPLTPQSIPSPVTIPYLLSHLLSLTTPFPYLTTHPFSLLFPSSLNPPPLPLKTDLPSGKFLFCFTFLNQGFCSQISLPQQKQIFCLEKFTALHQGQFQSPGLRNAVGFLC